MNLKRIAVALGGAFLASSAPATAQVMERVNVNAAGEEANASSHNTVSFSRDGRFVAFASWATNLIPNDSNGMCDCFVRDRLRGTIECVSVDSNGSMVDGGRFGNFDPSLSADGRFVAFESDSPDLVAGDTNNRTDVFVHDRLTGVTERVSVDSTGMEQKDGTYWNYPTISADGRFVVLLSDATNLVAGDTNGEIDVFVHDRQSGITERVSVATSGAEGNGTSRDPSISEDGRFVAFNSEATNFLSVDANGTDWDAFVRDRQTGTTTLVSIDSSGTQGDDSSFFPSLSEDGRFVAFESLSSNLVDGDSNGVGDVFVHDCVTGTTERVSVDSAGAQADGRSDVTEMERHAISADGRFVAFASEATNLVKGDTNGIVDLFVRDRQLGTTIRVNVGSAGEEANNESRDIAITDDGRFIGFISGASNIVAGDNNGSDDVFVRGPWLTLEADPPQVAAGATLTFSTWTGDASNLALLALIGIDGAPMFIPAAISAFDAEGVWPFSATVPSGLSGSVWTFRSYGFVPTGKVQASNDVAVTFQ